MAMRADELGTPWQANAIEVRSVALANQSGWGAGAAKYRWGAPDHCEQFAVMSKTTGRRDYITTYHIASDRVCHCTCKAGEFGNACTHRGAVRLWIERRRAQVAFCEEMRDAGFEPYTPVELISDMGR